jgi:hypothetical protein
VKLSSVSPKPRLMRLWRGRIRKLSLRIVICVSKPS